MIKILAFDLDDTALNSKKELTPRTREAIIGAIDRGIITIPCTGREIGIVPDDVFAIPGLSYIITNNGAQIYSMPERKAVYSKCIEANAAKAVLLECRKFKAFIFASIGTKNILDSEGVIWAGESAKSLAPDYIKAMRIPMGDLAGLMDRSGDPVYKYALIVLDDEELERIKECISGLPGVYLTSSGEENLEVMPPGASKGEALKFVCSLAGVDLADVMAVGDNYNDMEMISEAGYSVAMGNAVEELKELADSVTLDCDEEGLAIAIERMCLR